MKKFIVMTTINHPTEATIKFSEKKDWQLVVVGDLKTPAAEYREINCIFLSPEYQESHYKVLSDIIGWNTIQRRNIGFVDAYRAGADIVATVDDDNIPYDSWGDDLLIGRSVEVDIYKPANGVFDPLSVTNHSDLWHRGFPIELLGDRLDVDYVGKDRMTPLIQADLWDGDPDIDAIARISKRPIVKFDVDGPYASYSISPFNSQNTFLAREVLPYYSVWPFVGRMDDIWAGYRTQWLFPGRLVYNTASVYQDRNEQDLVRNLEDELIGYRNTKTFLDQGLDLMFKSLPYETLQFLDEYDREMA